MAASWLVKFRPAGPWRFGPDNGARDRVNAVGHSDTVYSAVCEAMRQLGELEAWLDATARAAEPAVRFTSLFPYQGRMLFAPPPQHLWPPYLAQRLRFQSARFAPVNLIQDLVSEQPPREERWEIDSFSRCVIPAGGQPPFRIALRSAAAVDRLNGNAAPHQTACLEFNQGAGYWMQAEFAGDAWQDRLRAALLLLADTGLGGERSRGWGRSEGVEIHKTGPLLEVPAAAGEQGHWLLSLYSPAADDGVQWERGDYALVTRNGRVAEAGVLKRSLRMVTEGSVVIAAARPRGASPDVAPAGSPHPVYRFGSPVSIALPWKAAGDRGVFVPPAAVEEPAPPVEEPAA
jgi:CRISPR type III-A-associated RAMP protein Csm4